MRNVDPTTEYIEYICSLYDDVYDDRVEDCKPPAAGVEYCAPGADWIPGQQAKHKSLIAFRKELEDIGIKLSSSKIRKILISGGCWSTERSREIGGLFDEYTKPVSEGGKGLNNGDAVALIAMELGVSVVTVSVNLPYLNVVYNLENKSSNAKRCARYKERKRSNTETTFESFLKEQLKDPEFKAEWDALNDARVSSGLTQSELAKKTGIAQGDISKIENGNGNPSYYEDHTKIN